MSDSTNLFSPNEYEKNDKIILWWKKSFVLNVVSMENFKPGSIRHFQKNICSFYYLKQVWK